MNQIFSKQVRLMGNQFEISVVNNYEKVAMEWIEQGINHIREIEYLLTTYSNSSDLYRINESAGIKPVIVQKETLEIIDRSLQISALTQGAFDISYGSVDKRLWNFDIHQNELPDPETAKKMVRLINYRNIIIDKMESTVFLKEKGMRIGLGGIGKGYAAEKTRNYLKTLGATAGIVNASGDLTTWGKQPNGKPWTIGIANPNHAASAFSFIEVSDMAVATSGNYEKFIMVDGKKYSHTINPKTGLPIHGIKSVTIITTNAELADALTTPIAIMGIEAGLFLINQLNGVEAIIIDDDDRVYLSNHIELTNPVT
ncbi:MAG: FAD:protein FMN transferase [Chitinophagia bacterium]|nr:FAD:protein FMN transferase [Chitinophagia bacterium]